MESEVLKLRIRGRVWAVRWVDRTNSRWDLDKYLGMCFYDEHAIELSNEIPEDQRTPVFIHEVTHAVLPKLTEREVLRLERDLTNALLKFGALTKRRSS